MRYAQIRLLMLLAMLGEANQIMATTVTTEYATTMDCTLALNETSLDGNSTSHVVSRGFEFITIIPTIVVLHGQFLIDDRIRIQGKLDDLSIITNNRIEYALIENAADQPNWKKVNVQWNPGRTNPENCPRCFTFEIPVAELPSKTAWPAHIKVRPVNEITETQGTAVVAQFDLASFIQPYFLDHQGYPRSCNPTDLVTTDHTNPVVKLKLVVSHAIDQLNAELDLPEETTYKGGATVLHSDDINPIHETDKQPTTDFSFNPNAVHQQRVSFTLAPNQLLRPGAYFVSIPVAAPAQRMETRNSSPESFLMSLQLHAPKSPSLTGIDPYESRTPVTCEGTWDGP